MNNSAFSQTLLEVPVTLTNGGTGSSLSDPAADRILFWDDSAGVVTWLTAGTGLSISGTTLTASGSVGGSDTQVQFNDGGNFGGDSGFTYNKTTNVLTVEDIKGLTGSNFTLTTPNSDGTSDIAVTAGNALTTGNIGGSIVITSGNGGDGGGGASVGIDGGDASNPGAGAGINLQGGSGVGTGAGNVEITGGNGSAGGDGGSVKFKPGSSSGGTEGSIYFQDASSGLSAILDTNTIATSDRTFTFPNVSGTFITTGNLTSITTTGTISSGTWQGTTIGVAYGGTGQTSYTDGQLLIGNTTGNTLAKATLTGTANQIVVTNGSGTITLSTPQDIATASSPTFAGLNLGTGNLSTVGNIAMESESARDLTVNRRSSGDVAGNNLTIQSGGATAGGSATNKAGGTLNLKSGISTGTGVSVIDFFTATNGSSGTSDNTPTVKMRLSGGGNGRLFIGGGTNGSVDGLEFAASTTVTRTIQNARNTTSDTAGNSLTVKSGGSTSGATNKAAGNLILATGLSTGSGSGQILLQTTGNTAASTTDNTLTTRVTIDVNGLQASSARIQAYQGADVASANNLVLGLDGNVFEITGTTQINLISNLTWQNGSVVHLMFTSNPTVKNGQTTSSTNITILLSGAADFVASANDVLTLVLGEIGGTQAWREISRSVN